MNADGSNVSRLTTNLHSDNNPKWSPDGSKIIFNTNRDGNNELYVMNPDGNGQARLTNTAASDDGAHFQRMPNLAPGVSSDSIKILANTSAHVDVLSNDADEEPLGPANLTIHAQPSHGTATIESGKVKYTPATGYVGTDQLTYQVCDSFMLDQKCSTAVLGIAVTPAAAVTKVGSVAFENGKARYVSPTSRPTFSGTATPGATVKVEIHSDPIILTTTADGSGNWSITPDQDLPAGDHTVYISATLNGVTTELDSFVLGISQTIPNTGSNNASQAAVGLLLLVLGSGMALYNHRQSRAQTDVPQLFP